VTVKRGKFNRAGERLREETLSEREREREREKEKDRRERGIGHRINDEITKIPIMKIKMLQP
jgi:hypothetical protein